MVIAFITLIIFPVFYKCISKKKLFFPFQPLWVVMITLGSSIRSLGNEVHNTLAVLSAFFWTSGVLPGICWNRFFSLEIRIPDVPFITRIILAFAFDIFSSSSFTLNISLTFHISSSWRSCRLISITSDFLFLSVITISGWLVWSELIWMERLQGSSLLFSTIFFRNRPFSLWRSTYRVDIPVDDASYLAMLFSVHTCVCLYMLQQLILWVILLIYLWIFRFHWRQWLSHSSNPTRFFSNCSSNWSDVPIDKVLNLECKSCALSEVSWSSNQQSSSSFVHITMSAMYLMTGRVYLWHGFYSSNWTGSSEFFGDT